MNTECHYEILQFGEGNPLFSRDEVDTLTAKPRLIKELLYIFPQISQETMEGLCESCGLCQPTIDIDIEHQHIAIQRENYAPIVEYKQTNLIELTHFEVPPEIHHHDQRILIIDDNNYYVTQLAQSLADYGYPTTGMTVADWSVTYDQIQKNAERIFEAVRSETPGPTHIICDKNFHATDGFYLASELQRFFWVFLCTGEQHTRESHRVADVFFEKTDPELLYKIHNSIAARPYPKE